MSVLDLKRALVESPHHAAAFLVLGDPDPELSVRLAVEAVDSGFSMLELGMPFSDPCADGPAVQEACRRALAAGVSTSLALDILREIHARRPGPPKNLLIYGNLVHARGYGRFCRDAVDAGGSSLLVPDIPLEESSELGCACAEAGLGHVHLVGPRTGPERLAALDAAADGFLYLAAHQGITGARGDGQETRNALVARVAGQVRNPVCLGFGLTCRSDLEGAFRSGAAMAVVGSRLARVIGSSIREGDEAIQGSFREACRELTGEKRLVAGTGPREDGTC